MSDPQERFYFYRTQMEIPRVAGEAQREVIQLCWRKIFVMSDGTIREFNESGIENINLSDYPEAKTLIEQLTPILVQAAEAQIVQRQEAITGSSPGLTEPPQ